MSSKNRRLDLKEDIVFRELTGMGMFESRDAEESSPQTVMVAKIDLGLERKASEKQIAYIKFLAYRAKDWRLLNSNLKDLSISEAKRVIERLA